MSAFQPTTMTLHPPADKDALGVAVVAALKRNLGYKLTWNMPVLLVTGLATAGFAPLVILLLRWRTFATGETFQLVHVGEWMRSTRRSTHDLLDVVARVTAPSLWKRPALYLLLLAAGLAAALLARAPAEALALWTYLASTARGPAYLASGCMLALFLGYLDLCEAVLAHNRRVRNFHDVFHRAVDSQIDTAGAGALSAILWLLAALAFVFAGAFWGAGMMVAGYTHRRYINCASNDMRATIAGRIESMMS